MDYTVETLRPGDDEARHRLGRQAFGHTAPFDPDAPRFTGDEVVAAYDGETLLGTVVTLPMVQHFGGAGIPCGGVSGVVVAPEARGRRVATTLLEESFRRMLDRGQPISSLYPTTAALYRSVGFEVAGHWTRRAVPLAEAPPDRLDRWERVEVGDPRLRAIDEAGAARHDGWVHFSDEVWASHAHRLGNEKNVNRYAYVGHRGAEAVAAVIYKYVSSNTGPFYELDAELLSGVDVPALASAIGFLAAHGTTATEIRTTVPSHLLTLLVDHLQRCRVIDDWPWMLRLVDVGAAMAARGWSAAVTATFDLDVADDALPANAGPGRLSLRAGTATWEPGGSGTIAISVQDLAALYSGYADPVTLASAGRLPGATTEDLAAMAAAFAGHPTLCDFF